MIRSLYITALLFTFASLISSLTCLDRHNQPTGWFTILKYPRKLTKYQPHHAFLSENTGNKMVIINSPPDAYGEAVPNTIRAINNATNILAFNDDVPGPEAHSSKGHAKGILAYDEKKGSGVYLIHSLPNFPEVKNNQLVSEFPPNTHTYGQHVYCVTFQKENLEEIVESLMVVEPHDYFSKGIFKDLKKRRKGSSPSRIINWNLANGDMHYMFTKSSKHAKFLYEDMISGYFGSSLRVSSWGRPYQLPSCGLALKTLNVKKIMLHNGDSWTGGSDHSKWAVSERGRGKPVTCFCDLNRMTSQKSRGGGCLCSSNRSLHEAFSSMIVETDSCNYNDL